MKPILVLYSGHDAETSRIATEIVGLLHGHHVRADVFDYEATPLQLDLAAYGAAIPVRRPVREEYADPVALEHFVEELAREMTRRDATERKRSVMLSRRVRAPCGKARH